MCQQTYIDDSNLPTTFPRMRQLARRAGTDWDSWCFDNRGLRICTNDQPQQNDFEFTPTVDFYGMYTATTDAATSCLIVSFGKASIADSNVSNQALLTTVKNETKCFSWLCPWQKCALHFGTRNTLLPSNHKIANC